MSDLIIRLQRGPLRWSVYRTGDEFARYVTSFDSLLAAENFVTRGEGHEEES